MFINIRLWLIVITFTVLGVGVYGQTLDKQALNKINTLQSLIDEAELLGFDVQREKLAHRTAVVFLEFAEWDENNIEKNTEYFSLVYDDDIAGNFARGLADFERNDIIKLLNKSIETIQKVIAGDIIRKPTPIVNWNNITIEEDQLTYDGRPVFIADYTWKPQEPELTEFYGNLDGFYIAPNQLINKEGDINRSVIAQLNNKEDGNLGSIFIAHTNPPEWTLEAYGTAFNQFQGKPFHYYDIDNPGAREMMSMLLAGTVPKMAGKNYTKLGYMLANEPRWLTHKDGTNKVWYSVDVSNFTKEKFKTWLELKHQDINHLNSLWGTHFSSFSEVYIETPIELSLYGTPKWYDWVSFNEDRVTDWYKFLRNEVLKHDPSAKTHLKIIPSFFTNNVINTGIDWEALTEISDINGNDATANHKMLWGKQNELADKYSYDWRELFMGYDFLKSVNPKQINFNSESHFLSASHSRDLYLQPEYVRAVHWAAHILGLNATRTWYWPRNADGSVNGRSDYAGYPGSNNQQPRVTNELHATIMDLNSYSEEIMAMQRQRKPLRIFYSKTSANNHKDYMDNIFELYEGLNFEGIPLGFVTKNILTKQDKSNWDVVLIYQTPNVTQSEFEAVQSYIDNGGVVIMDNESLKMNEYHLSLKSSLSNSKGKLFVVNAIEDMKAKAFNIIEAKHGLPEVIISEMNKEGSKTCFWRCVKNAAGNNVVSIINLGKKDVQVKLTLRNALYGTACKDLLQGIAVTSTPTLSPNDVYFVEVTDNVGINSGIFSQHVSAPIATLFPNPSRGTFQLRLFNYCDYAKLRVYDLIGNKISEGTFNNTNSIFYNIEDEPKGTYVVQLISNNETQSFLYRKK